MLLFYRPPDQVENEDFSNFLKDSDVEAHRVLHAIHECFNKKKLE